MTTSTYCLHGTDENFPDFEVFHSNLKISPDFQRKHPLDSIFVHGMSILSTILRNVGGVSRLVIQSLSCLAK
jgi:hypothetical protein